MAELIQTILFYLFAAATVGSGVAVISSKNPVHSVFFLILAFFNAAGLFLLIGAEFIAMTLIIVYVGAVAVLFLFVVMMLNINFEELREGFLKYLPVGLFVAAVLFAELILTFWISFHVQHPVAAAAQPIADAGLVSNTKAIGNVLYTYYLFPFQLSGLVLLVAMIGAIVLCLRGRTGVRKQKISEQVGRRPRDGMEIVKVKSGEGIS